MWGLEAISRRDVFDVVAAAAAAVVVLGVAGSAVPVRAIWPPLDEGGTSSIDSTVASLGILRVVVVRSLDYVSSDMAVYIILLIED